MSSPTILIIYLAKRFFSFREKKLELEVNLAAEKTAQYAASNKELEQRVRVIGDGLGSHSTRHDLDRTLQKCGCA